MLIQNETNPPLSAPSYIVVEGPIGVGKTSLARKLSQTLGAELMLERPDENPFLERFYQSRKRYALPTQLYFLFQRVQQLKSLRQTDMFTPSRVADFLLEKDALFAEVNLADDELSLYRKVYGELAMEVPRPDLVVYLQAPVDVLLKRIRRRGLDYESAVEPEYIEQLSEAYTRLFLGFTASPLLIVNAAEINLVDGEADYQMLLEQILSVRSGRHFYNPLAASRS